MRWLSKTQTEQWLAFPKSVDILQEVSGDQLEKVKHFIDEALEKKTNLYYNNTVQVKYFYGIDEEHNLIYRRGIAYHDFVIDYITGEVHTTEEIELFYRTYIGTDTLDNMIIELEWKELTEI